MSLFLLQSRGIRSASRWSLPALLVLLCACSPPGEIGSLPRTTTIVFKHGKVAADPRVMAALLREFEERHPGVKVQEEILPSSSDQQHQFYVMTLEGRQAPFDLLAADTIWVQEFARSGWIRPLDNLLAPAERELLFPGPLLAATFQGRLYAMPWYMDAGLLYYRRDLLDLYGFSPPRTWPELAAVARRILDAEQNPRLAGFVWQGKQYEGLICVALEFLRSSGSGLWEGNETSAGTALQFMRDLIAKDGVTPLTVATADEEGTRHLFGAGRAIFLRNWPYAWSLFQQEGSAVKGKVGIAPLPSFPGHAGVPTLGGWTLAIPTRAPHPQEAADLIRYLSSPDVQRRMALEIGYKPVRRDLYADGRLLRAQPWLRDLQPTFLAAKPRPVTPYYLMLSQMAQPELSAVVVGMKSPEEALQSIRTQAAFILGSPQPGQTFVPN
jgi:trehalose/maltose transport system substrate-binding protein